MKEKHAMKFLMEREFIKLLMIRGLIQACLRMDSSMVKEL